VASQCSLSWRQRAWQLLCAPGSVCRVSLGAALLGHLHRSCHACTIGLLPNRCALALHLTLMSCVCIACLRNVKLYHKPKQCTVLTRGVALTQVKSFKTTR